MAVVAVAVALILTGCSSNGTVEPPARDAPVTSIAYSSLSAFGTCDDLHRDTIDVASLSIVTDYTCRKPPTSESRTVAQCQMDEFIDAIEDTSYRQWRKEYVDHDILDGGGFDLLVTFADGTQLATHAMNEFPADVRAFWDAIEAILDPAATGTACASGV